MSQRLLRVWTFALLLGCLCPTARAADYPDEAPPPPQRDIDRGEDGSRYFRADAQTRPLTEANSPSTTAPQPLQLRFPAREDSAADGSNFANAVEPDAPQVVRTRASLPLAPSSGDSRSGNRGGEVSPLVTGAASLGIVLGLFLLVVWTVRRGMPKQATLLPREAVEVLGRAPLIGRQQVHLVRCGNKILLLSVSPGGAETLTEITDPVEVDRLSGICQQTQANSATAAFKQIFEQFDPKSTKNQFAPKRGELPDFERFEAASSQEMLA